MSALLRLPELAKYELLEELGHGGMASVFRARDRRLGREVAIKLIHRHLRDSAEVAERFVREATAVAKLRHPNIVEVYDISDPEESERYLVVELVRGITLRERLRLEGALPPEVAVAVALEVGAGLEHAHRQGVIHRDVKPENVLIELSSEVGPGGERVPPRIKLTDFGIAKLLDAQGVTSTGQVLGSPAHMAPEQIEGGVVDARTDVFALGVLLYEAMVGRLPFTGDHPAQVLRKVLDGDFVPPERQDPKIGASYSRLIVRALAHHPDQRFESVHAMLEALRRELASLGFNKVQPLLEAVARPDPGFFDKLVTRLVERGSQARAEGRMAAAADHFGRALAYRPGDRQLLRRVSGLQRNRRLRRVARWVVTGGLGTGLAVAILYQVFGASWAEGWGGARTAGEFSPVPLPRAAASDVRSAPPAPEPAPPAPRIVTSQAEPVAVRPPAIRRPPSELERETVVTRDVVVRITGAMGGTLKIDGQPYQWFGDVRHPLSLGSHHFEFIAPDSTCCRSSERTVIVTPGEGVQEVIGEIAFLDATLRVSADDGQQGLLTCPTLFSGDQHFPGDRRVAMSRVKATGTCTLRAEASGSMLQKTEVVLRAGQTTVIPWP
jgi:tRNA A-37 threonylcarbamoyl transferase component Bud32